MYMFIAYINVPIPMASTRVHLPLHVHQFDGLLLRINATVLDILAINISLANQSLLLAAANNALTTSISAR